MQRTLTIASGASAYLQSVLAQAAQAAAVADGAYTSLIRQAGIEGSATLVSLTATTLVVDLPEDPTA